MPNWESRKLVSDDQRGLLATIQRGSITFRGDLGSGLTPAVALGQDSTLVATVTLCRQPGLHQKNPGPGGLREGLTWERRGRRKETEGAWVRAPAPHLWRAPVFCNPVALTSEDAASVSSPLGPRPALGIDTPSPLGLHAPARGGVVLPMSWEQTDPEGSRSHAGLHSVLETVLALAAPWTVASVSSQSSGGPPGVP